MASKRRNIGPQRALDAPHAHQSRPRRSTDPGNAGTASPSTPRTSTTKMRTINSSTRATEHTPTLSARSEHLCSLDFGTVCAGTGRPFLGPLRVRTLHEFVSTDDGGPDDVTGGATSKHCGREYCFRVSHHGYLEHAGVHRLTYFLEAASAAGTHLWAVNTFLPPEVINNIKGILIRKISHQRRAECGITRVTDAAEVVRLLY
ncbi:hypothetical protein AAG570_007039 [Ranatra chinensis]|uniref:Uncharacterized protein n=1 Tax=Ranatra chinensis TaxID=642074 RepID=A0ABD0Z8F8_9HEMI